MSKNNYQQRQKNLPTVMDFCDDAGLKWKFIAGDWHIRIEGKFDVFPTSKRWHYLPTEAWGSYEDYDELGRIFMEQMV